MKKQLYRSNSNRMVAGVCGGLADYFGIDSAIVRIIAIVLLLPGGAPGLVPYLIFCIAVPNNPDKTK